ncbi:MAG TPA: sugar phosphate nucleotidyltransferase [Tepidisphaeraceae bacterium]|jgi:NDP-sugar pyrophosphorylase family protein|nr:sugar phosphate nucleotidyltransferase [Tepidisphaeraceae bacterium]
MKEMPVAILAGGFATRLGDLATQTPKALLDINGRPFIDHQLDLLYRNGIRRVVMCVGHLSDRIERHLGDGAVRDMEIRYSHDGPDPAGTGGAIRRAIPMLGDMFWVMYGDSYMDIDYRSARDHFADSDALALMTVIRNDDRWDRSNAIYENGRLRCYDKSRRAPEMRHIDYGVQLLRSAALLAMAPGERFGLGDIYRGLVARGQMIGFEVFNRFYEIGTPASLEETRRYLAKAA